MTLEDIPSLLRTRVLFTTRPLHRHTVRVVPAGIINTPPNNNILRSILMVAADILPVALLRMDHRTITMRIRSIPPLMPHPLVLRVTTEGVIEGVAFVAGPPQIEVAIVALASRAPLGTLHSKRRRRHLPLPLEATVSRQMKKLIRGPPPQMRMRVPRQTLRPMMIMEMPLWIAQTMHHQPPPTMLRPKMVLKRHHKLHPSREVVLANSALRLSPPQSQPPRLRSLRFPKSSMPHPQGESLYSRPNPLTVNVNVNANVTGTGTGTGTGIENLRQVHPLSRLPHVPGESLGILPRDQNWHRERGR